MRNIPGKLGQYYVMAVDALAPYVTSSLSGMFWMCTVGIPCRSQGSNSVVFSFSQYAEMEMTFYVPKI